MPIAPTQVERPVRDLRRAGRRRRTMARDALLMLGLVAVGFVMLRLVLPDGPLTASATDSPSASTAAVGSVGPPSLGPIRTPSLVTLTPVATPSNGAPSPVPTRGATVGPEPEPTARPGQTPRPTPVPTRTPSATAPNRATVIVVMHVINNSGGSATASDWDMILTGEIGTASPNFFPGSESGTAVSVPAGKGYRVIDDASVAGYAGRLSSPDCLRADGSGGLAAGTTVTCTITRNDRPRVRVRTNVINDDGGTASANDVSMTVTGANATPGSFAGSESGVIVVVRFDVAFDVSASNLSGYTKSSSGACSGTLGVNAPIAECIFTFDDEPAPTEPPPTDPPTAGLTGPTAPVAPLAWLLPAWVVAGLGGRRWWTTLRSR